MLEGVEKSHPSTAFRTGKAIMTLQFMGLYFKEDVN